MVMLFLNKTLSYSFVKPSLGLQPRPYVLREVPLRFSTEVHAWHAEPFDLARADLEPVGDLLARQDCSKRLVTPLL